MSTNQIGRRALVGLAIVTFACGGSPQGGAGQAGTFTANLTGSATTQLNGYANSSGQPGTAYVLQLITPGGENNIMISREGDGRPDPGTYPLVDYTASTNGAAKPHFVIAVQLDQSVMVGQGFDRAQGDLVVTSSTATQIVGTFQVTMRLSRDPASTVTVNGTFTANHKVM